ncbi:MAG TPA: M24 family metallopeptidase [Patescibacteria group bacterium]|nr:M24 family metallopeptidase [Patescibacteria group bacterium]
MIEKLSAILQDMHIDAYVGYDFRGSNYNLKNTIGFHSHTTRRWVGIITASGTLHLIIPKLEESIFAQIEAEKHIYITHQEFSDALSSLVKDMKVIATDFSGTNDIPVMDVIPAGFKELLEKSAPQAKIVTSANIAQKIAATWGEKGYASHKKAADSMAKIVHAGWDFVREARRNKKEITDLDVENFILEQYKTHHLVVEPNVCIVSTNQHASNPHYWPTEENHFPIKPNSLLLFDVWARSEEVGSIYTDVTYMAWIGPDEVPAKVKEVWETVRDARNAGVHFVKENFKKGIQGCQVDDVVRDVIEKKGYGKYFVHRTGHSIDTNDHGAGTNIDNFETKDTRDIVTDTGFSIEPGIYLPEFGVRSELDMYIHPDGTAEVTTWKQEELEII